jgi:hypothetical protein
MQPFPRIGHLHGIFKHGKLSPELVLLSDHKSVRLHDMFEKALQRGPSDLPQHNPMRNTIATITTAWGEDQEEQEEEQEEEEVGGSWVGTAPARSAR